MTKKAIKISGIVTGVVLFIAALVLASIYDLEISKKIADLNFGEYYSENVFGRVFECIGEMPIYFLLAFSAAICFFNCLKITNKAIKITFLIVCAILAYGFMFVAVRVLIGYVSCYTTHFRKNSAVPLVLQFFVPLLILTALYFLVNALNSETRKNLIIFAIIVFATAAISQAITQSIKPIIGRPRFRALNFLNDFSFYSPWYKISKVGLTDELAALGITEDAFKSFPSGHTAAATMLVTLWSLPMLVKSLSGINVKITLYSISLIYIIIVAISRVVMGAHFLSDVLFGFAITLISYYVSRFAVFKLVSRFGAKIENYFIQA